MGWNCAKCTFNNENDDHLTCAMCNEIRVDESPAKRQRRDPPAGGAVIDMTGDDSDAEMAAAPRAVNASAPRAAYALPRGRVLLRPEARMSEQPAMLPDKLVLAADDGAFAPAPQGHPGSS